MHLLRGLPQGRLHWTVPSIIVFTSHWSSILQMCPNSFNFLCFIKSTVVWLRSTLFLMLLLVTLSFQHTFHISTAVSFLVLVHGKVTIIFVVSVCLSVCLCRVFLSRLRSDLDQTRTHVTCPGLVVSPRIWATPGCWVTPKNLYF